MDEALRDTASALVAISRSFCARGGLSEPVEILALFLAEIRCVWPSLQAVRTKAN